MSDLALATPGSTFLLVDRIAAELGEVISRPAAAVCSPIVWNRVTTDPAPAAWGGFDESIDFEHVQHPQVSAQTGDVPGDRAHASLEGSDRRSQVADSIHQALRARSEVVG